MVQCSAVSQRRKQSRQSNAKRKVCLSYPNCTNALTLSHCLTAAHICIKAIRCQEIMMMSMISWQSNCILRQGKSADDADNSMHDCCTQLQLLFAIMCASWQYFLRIALDNKLSACYVSGAAGWNDGKGNLEPADEADEKAMALFSTSTDPEHRGKAGGFHDVGWPDFSTVCLRQKVGCRLLDTLHCSVDDRRCEPQSFAESRLHHLENGSARSWQLQSIPKHPQSLLR